MKLLFVHDGPVFVDRNGKYYAYSYHDMYKKYSFFTSDISFITRVLSLSKTSKCDPLDSRISIVKIPDFKSPKKINLIKSAKKIISEHVKNCDMLILRTSMAASIAFKYAKKFNKPFIYEVVGCVWDAYTNHGISGKLIAGPAYLRTRHEVANSDYVHYVTSEFLQKRYPAKGATLSCSDVSIKPVDKSILDARFKKINRLKDTKSLVLGTAAAIDVKYKGQQYVIKAMSKLNKEGYKLKYMLAGTNASNSHYLQDLAKKYGVEDSVHFCGSLNSKQIIDFYGKIDVYIQPSSQEGLPRSVVEAMSRACPCLGSNAGGTYELIDAQCIFKKKSVKDIIKFITMFDKENLLKQSNINFRKVFEFYNDNLNTKRMAFYHDFRRQFK